MHGRRIRRALTSLMLLIFLVPSMLGGGVCALKSRAFSAKDGAPCVVSLNVCGSGSAAVSPSALDAVSMPYIDTHPYFPAISALPAVPAPTVASVCIGDIEKPPKA